MGKLKLKKGIKKFLKWTAIIIGILFALFIALVIYIVVVDLKQEEVLKQEIINYSNRDLANDNYDITVKTTGDYAYVEEAIKKYYKSLSNNVKTVNSYLNSDRINNILTAENLISDRPDYTLSRNTLKTAKEKVNEGIDNIKELCDEKTIKHLLDKNKLDDPDYYYDFYLQLMYTEQDKEEFEKLKLEMDVLSTDLNAFLDKIDEILVFLQTNNSQISFIDGIMYFSTDQVLAEYKQKIVELDELATKITVEEENNTESDSL